MVKYLISPTSPTLTPIVSRMMSVTSVLDKVILACLDSQYQPRSPYLIQNIQAIVYNDKQV